MKEEIAATVVFLTMLVKKHKQLSKQKIEKFAAKLTTILFAKYKNHWYAENPMKGQAFRYGEKNDPFTIASFKGKDGYNAPKRISHAVEKATSDYYSGTSSDEELTNKEPKTIPKVSNPNSIYQCADYSQAIPSWSQYPRRKNYQNNGYPQNPPMPYYPQQKAYKAFRQSSAFSGPRVDRYHWVNMKRSAIS
ncbi:maternal B9.10 protein isoform X2 [Xenopus laevis]|uniref:Maternal B9.10 protein isoform X2 n=1 Tax=Xenopus laevis TaxID=8355 RepID=A0A8J1L444_XENLA|nr:maternal B9.10 protein isoform X2 [Xenopus laevis]